MKNKRIKQNEQSIRARIGALEERSDEELRNALMLESAMHKMMKKHDSKYPHAVILGFEKRIYGENEKGYQIVIAQDSECAHEICNRKKGKCHNLMAAHWIGEYYF
jgi:hypothetical protein